MRTHDDNKARRRAPADYLAPRLASRLASRLATVLALVLLALVLLAMAPARAVPRALPAYQVDLNQTTVSGLSSGAFMAGQFAVAYSGIVTGVGLIAGGPYFCAGHPGNPPFIPYLVNAMSACMNPADSGVEPPDAMVSWARAQDFARAGLIDSVANLQRQSVYLFSGTADTTVTTAVVDQVRRFYELAGATQLRYVDNVAAGHAMITDRAADHACAVTAPPYFNDCGIRQAQEILNFLYTGLNPPTAQLHGKIVAFDQRHFAPPFSSMSATGYAFVPASCASQSCRVHVAFHGCRQGTAAIGDHFYAHAGYNEVADTNNIIVLYPQVAPSQLYPYNPKGCWDFWGYTSADPFAPDFFTRTGAQMAAVRAMLAQLARPRGAH